MYATVIPETTFITAVQCSQNLCLVRFRQSNFWFLCSYWQKMAAKLETEEMQNHKKFWQSVKF